MRTSTLIHRSLVYHWRTHLAVAFGVATAVAVLAGALLIGDSVRASLKNIFLLRIGSTDVVVSAGHFFREKLADDLGAHPKFSTFFRSVCPMIAVKGIVIHQKSGRRGSDVHVYGVDDRFWTFHRGETDIPAPKDREILISESLADELAGAAGDTLLVRMEKPSDIPAGSLHGQKDDVGLTMRFTMHGILPASDLGEFSLQAQQTAVRAVFVPLRRLQMELDQEGRINTILVANNPDVNKTGSDGGFSRDAMSRILKDSFSLEDVSLKLTLLQNRGWFALESRSMLLGELATKAALAAATDLNLHPSPILTYLANSIHDRQREIPYSLLTALDPEAFESLLRLVSPMGGALKATPPAGAPKSDDTPSPILLNQWAARELRARAGDTITIDYYRWEDEGRLVTQRAEFRLAGTLAMRGMALDPDLAPHYPGITDAESLSDWDPPFPMNLGKISHRDEQYWDEFHTTPKGFLPLERGRQLWSSRYGTLTSLRLYPEGTAPLRSTLKSYQQRLRAGLDPLQLGFSVSEVRAQGLAASQGATDFGEYFLYFSFFLVVSALLLTGLFFKLGVEQRLREIGILRSLGFASSRIRSVFIAEGLILAVLGSAMGMVGAWAYGRLIMMGLRTWWIDAVGTSLLELHVSTMPMIYGALGGIATSLLFIAWTLRRLTRSSPRSLLSESISTISTSEADNGESGHGFFSSKTIAISLAVIGVLLLLSAQWIGPAGGFFGAGCLFLIAILFAQSAWLRSEKKRVLKGSGIWAMCRLGFRNATHHSGRSVLCIALIASATFLIVSIDAFRRNDQTLSLDKESGSGGFSLLAESILPLLHDPNTPEGRDALNLVTGDDRLFSDVTISRFRLRPGDDASCLNLYRPGNPRIVAPTSEFITSKRFTFQDSLAESDEERANPWLLLEAETTDGTIPVFADATSMTYVLHLSLGDELLLPRSGDAPLRLRLVGALRDSLFQGELLMSEKQFLRLFPDQEGYRFFLLDAPAERIASLTSFLEEGLTDFGFDVIPTAERLALFHRVENTYLSTFQTLGGLGLLLGTLGLGTVLLRNVLERRREMALQRAVGYAPAHLAIMVIAENAFLLCCGLLSGTGCAFLAITPALLSRGGRPPTLSLGLVLLAILITGMLASLAATAAALRAPLLPALRAE